jgi:hypothetical protein
MLLAYIHHSITHRVHFLDKGRPGRYHFLPNHCELALTDGAIKAGRGTVVGRGAGLAGRQDRPTPRCFG